jgi:hypothetical protein
MTLDLEKYTFTDGTTGLSAAELNARFYALVRRLHALEVLSIDWEAAVSEVRNYGLSRINDAVKPLLDSLSADLAALVAKGTEDLASQSAAVDAKLAEVDFKLTDVEVWLTQAEAVIAVAIPKSAMGVPGGVSTLNDKGWTPLSQLPLASNGGGGIVEALASVEEMRTGTNKTKVATPFDVASVLPNENYIMNGNFDLWTRAVTQTVSGYGSDDRWVNGNVGTTKTHSLQSFGIGDTLTWDSPAVNYSRTVVSSVVGVGNSCFKSQRVEFVRTLSGKKATLSFRAKADAARNMAIEFVQFFGNTGTPSTDVNGIGSQLVALTTNWKKYTITVDLPSIAGKTLGTSANDSLQVFFWFDAGSTYATRTSNLGQQSGTFDIAQVKLEEGSVATPFKSKTMQQERSACERFYEILTGGAYQGSGVATCYFGGQCNFKQIKRNIPTITRISIFNISPNCTAPFAQVINQIGFQAMAQCAAAGDVTFVCAWSADSEL